MAENNNNTQKQVKIPSGSGSELYDKSTLFASLFPIPEIMTYIQQAYMLDKLKINFTVNYRNELDGEAQMTGMQQLIEGDKPQPFVVLANFLHGKLHGTVIVYIYGDDNKLYQLEQMLFYHGKLCALLVISYSQIRLQFNSLIEQTVFLGAPITLDEFHIENILITYPLLNTNSDWTTKLLFAQSLCQSLSLPQF